MATGEIETWNFGSGPVEPIYIQSSDIMSGVYRVLLICGMCGIVCVLICLMWSHPPRTRCQERIRLIDRHTSEDNL